LIYFWGSKISSLNLQELKYIKLIENENI